MLSRLKGMNERIGELDAGELVSAPCGRQKGKELRERRDGFEYGPVAVFEEES